MAFETENGTEKASIEVPSTAAHDVHEPAASTQPQSNESEEKAVVTVASAAPVCGVCEKNPPKYKCPRCYLPYCSVACNRIHRENHPPDPEPEPRPEVPTAKPNETPDPRNPFHALDSSDKLKLLFAKYPGLPEQLLKIHAATQPPSEQKSAIPASLLKGLNKKDTWDHDVGVRRGKEALRRARKASGEEGEAIREYSELILHIMNEKGPGDQLATFLQQRAAEGDARLTHS